MWRVVLVLSACALAAGCEATRTAATAAAPAPICRVVPRQELPIAARPRSAATTLFDHQVAATPAEQTASRDPRVSGREVTTLAPVQPVGHTADPAPISPPSALGAFHVGLSAVRQRAIRQAQHENGSLAEPPRLAGEQGATTFIDADNKAGQTADPAPELKPEQPSDRYPITLATVLYLAGSSNLQVALAQERVREAYSRLDGAKVLWVPNISGGIGFNDHAGQLQNIEGQILEINRQSLFVGGGAGFGRTPLAGGANPPPRMGIDLSPVDVIFEPLAARQRANRASFDASVAFNDTLLNVSYVYLELVRAQAQLAIAKEAVANMETLVGVTSDFARTGLGLQADAQRAKADLADRQRETLAAEERIRVTSAELARLLRLDQTTVLFALESQPLPIELISNQVPLESLIAQGVRSRPEISREHAQIAATDSRVAQERWRPWVPNLHLGVGGGTFGGGRNDNFGDFSGRYDLDALAVWEVRNLGFGNRALVRERESQNRQALIDYHSWRDRVGQEVAAAYHQSVLRREQIAFAEQQVAAAADALPLNFNGIRGRELRPIEAQQAIAALALARTRYVNTVIEYNQAEFALWRAIGHPPDAAAMTTVPDAPPAAE